MNRMGVHSAGKGGPLRRAWIAAWIVTFAMGGTTMAFQVFHSVTRGHMPWPLAILYGIMPLLIAMLILEIVAEWHASSWVAKGVAYTIMLGSMYMSASGTGAVVMYAAPPHFSLLFGALLDAAELLAAFFIMNGPRAADEAAEAAAQAQRDAALRAAFSAEMDAEREARITAEAAAGKLADDLSAARAEAARAVADAEVLARKLDAAKGGPRGRKTGPRSSARTGPKAGSETGPEAMTIEAKILEILDEAAKSGREVRAPELVERTGCSDGYARKTLRKLNARDRPRDIVDDRSSDPVQDRGEDRS
jgi:hypothetical protein